ncbi:MAG: AMP-binding protein [Clostridiales bacterium]|nr:AMP-binding protein [Clostridiales bacterium]
MREEVCVGIFCRDGGFMASIVGKPLHEGVRYETMRDLILGSKEKFATKDAFVFRRKPTEAEIHKTYNDFASDVEYVAEAISLNGFQGKHLGVVGENAYEWMVSYSAILSSGSVGLPLDRLLPEQELINLLIRGKVDVLFYHQKHHEMILNIAKNEKENGVKVQKYVCMCTEYIAANLEFPKDDPRFVDIKDWIEEGRQSVEGGSSIMRRVAIDPEETRIILFTSGTTAMSKGVMLSHKNIMSNVYAISTTLTLHPGERIFSILPLHHTFENTCEYFMLVRGCCICFSDGLRYIVKNLNEWHVEACISVPLLFENIHGKIKTGIEESGKGQIIDVLIPVSNFLRKFKIDLRRVFFSSIIKKLGGHLRLIVIGGAGISKNYIEDFNNWGFEFLMGYGLTETSPVIAVTTSKCNVYGSVGRPITGVEVKIDTDSPKIGTVGEILSKSDCVMQGYYENPEATAEVLEEDGWFHTGDMGYLDKKGCLHITGRVKSMIVLTNGKKAFPEEMESLLNNIPGVKEAFVWGGKDEKDAVDICAKLLIDRKVIGENLPNPDTTAGDNAIREYLSAKMKEVNHQMPSYKAIHYFVFSETEMVKTTTLKVKRPQEQKAIEERLAKAGTTMKAANGQNLDTL